MNPRPETHEDDGPVRTCIVTRERRSPDEMIRFVLSPEGAVTADIRNRLPGRGVWLTASRSIVAEGARRKVFSRGFRGEAKVEGDLAAAVEALLERDALQMVSLANKAGLIVTGFAKVETALGGDVLALIHASDGGADGIRKLDQAARRRGRTVPVMNLFSGAQLDLALGRTNVIHAALKSGAAGEACLARCRRLQAFRGDRVEQASEFRPGSGTNE
jgi:predicted RNA-binding protein YlxR (DUF448 family)